MQKNDHDPFIGPWPFYTDSLLLTIFLFVPRKKHNTGFYQWVRKLVNDKKSQSVQVE